jgi:iron complex outermembrane receptor protein
MDLHNLLATVPLGEQGGIAGLFPGVVPNPLFGQPTIGSEDVIDIDHDNLVNPSTTDLHSDADIWGVALTLALELDWAQVKSITSYRDMEADVGFDTGATLQTIAHLGNSYDSNQFSEELQITGVALDDRLDWLLGFYYFEEDGTHLDYLVDFTVASVFSGTKIENRSTAGFAQFTFDVTEKLALTAGVRYTDESKDFIVPDRCYELPAGPVTLFDGTIVTCAQMHSVVDPKFANAGFLQFVNAPVFPAPGGRFCCIPVADADGNIVGLLPGLTNGDELLPRGTTERDFSDWTPMVNLAWQWTEDLMTYFSYSEGFKSGGYVQRVFPPRTEPPSFDAETAQVFEIGIKWAGFDNRVQASAAGFHTEYDDMHIQVNDGIAAVTRNAAAAEIDGFELELTAIPADGWLVQGGVGYMDAGYTELDDVNLVTDLFVLSEDSKLVNAPDWTTNLGVEYSHAVPRFGGTLVARVDWRYQSDVYKDAINFPDLHQDGYHLLDLGLTYFSENEKWEVSVFGRNVTDEQYIVSGFANALQYGTAAATIGRPAEWGVTFAYHFGQ